ncbi:MAG TPA: ABC transporter substrate-binding protein [Dehalococcoidia bacterium]|nr:ABC transporter substrate-binding protein [Dehalococcoidia bacterium]
MEQSEYWSRFWQRRLTRRRVLTTAAWGGAGLAAAGFVGCGDDDDDGGEGTGSPTGAASPTVAQPFTGGRLRLTASDPAGNLDAHKNITFTVQVANGACYSRLLRSMTAPDDPSTPELDLPKADWFRPVPDLAAEYEAVDDESLTWNFKLQDGAVWHSLPPINPLGRPVVPDDVVAAFEYYRTARPDKGINLAAIDSMTAAGTDTVQVKLKQPFGPLLIMLSSPSDLWIYPPELIESGEMNSKMVGSGPWVFKSYQQGVSMIADKNPNYWEKDEQGNPLPYLDGLDQFYITDKNQEISQYSAGQLDTILSLPAQLVDTVMDQVSDSILSQTVANLLFFLFFPPSAFQANKPPFNDPNVRKAVSLAINRDALLNLASAGKGGVWHNLVNGGTFWWVDPQDSSAFPEGEFFEHNPQKAKELLTAAGFADGLDINLHFTNNAYVNAVPSYNPQAEALPQMLAEAGINATLVPHDYQSEWINPQVGIFLGGLQEDNAIAWALETPVPHPWNQFVNQFTDQPRNHSKINDPDMLALIGDLGAESDFDRGSKIALSIMKRNAEMMYYVPAVGAYGFGVRRGWFERTYDGPTSYGGYTEEAVRSQIDVSQQQG